MGAAAGSSDERKREEIKKLRKEDDLAGLDKPRERLSNPRTPASEALDGPADSS